MKPPGRRSAVLLLTVATVLAAGTALALSRPPGEGGPAPAAGPRPVVLDADEHGSLVLDEGAGEVVGYGADGEIRWRNRELADRLYVSCLAACPDAVGSGASPGTAAAPAVWQVGDRSAADPSVGGVVLWAGDPEHLLTASDTGTGRTRIEARAPGSVEVRVVDGGDPHLYRAADRRHGLLVLSAGPDRSSELTVRRTAERWEVSEAATGGIRGACLTPSGDQAVRYGPTDVRRSSAAGGGELTVPVGEVGHCAAAGDQLLVQRFTGGEGEGEGEQTVTELWDATARLRWTRTTAGIHAAELDPAGTAVALPTDAGVLVLDTAGAELGRYPGATDAQYVSPGCLLVLGPGSAPATHCTTPATTAAQSRR